MKKGILAIILMFGSILAIAQNYGTKGQNYGIDINPNDGFSEKLKKASEATYSILCDFEQTKYMSVLAKPVNSKGQFYYTRADNICLEYSVPKGNIIVMSNGKFKIVNSGKTIIVSNKTNPMMRQLNGMLTACMTGNISLFGSESITKYYESDNAYTVVITPTSNRVKTHIKQIILSFDKQNMTLLTMQMDENETDYTKYEFKAKKLNCNIPQEKFKI
ncbi:MAG: outer membrane lipoprotein carrier protein LolA [Bacteroidales bacterium]